ncbi:uncharacterized protein PV07_05372 [Cladophialophora immunda]|uniref:Zn(2)-C6 fungal-type domain-containing protein n=1 Tax=Cladophialophora immunda TaxID=569365 RepID=A0A0D2D1E2_9EURO|nr:uncharacterized protein PV07_05372 [Cladophialophora immunda]KIW29564.1 hypothetical protein PV07_05372 [Cladophialophora immunda]
MPVLIDGEKGQARRKRFAPKTRTGCVNCKTRRIKCGEEKPSCRRCVVSRLECSYKVPETWFFESKLDATRNFNSRSGNPAARPPPPSTLVEFTSFLDGEGDASGEDGQDKSAVSARGSHSPAVSSWAGPKLYRSQHECDAFQSWVTFLVRYVEPRARFPGNADPDPDIYRLVIPQIAYHSMALRDAMIACGTLVQAVQRKYAQAAYQKTMAMVLQYATRAIRELATSTRPLIEVVLTAYTFWSLDLMSCNFQSAMMHLLSALQIARQCRKALASDELASLFVEGMVFNLPDPQAAPPPDIGNDPPDIRRIKAVVKLEVEYDRVAACTQRVTASDVPNKRETLAILDESRREVQWILSKYNTAEQYTRWLLHKAQQVADGFSVTMPKLENRPGIFQKLVRDVDEYLARSASGDAQSQIPMGLWRKDASSGTLTLMVLTAGTDLPLRHITMDFFETARQIRWPGRCQL